MVLFSLNLNSVYKCICKLTVSICDNCVKKSFIREENNITAKCIRYIVYESAFNFLFETLRFVFCAKPKFELRLQQ